MKNRVKFVLVIVILTGSIKCSNSSECVTFDCRKDDLIVRIEPNTINLGESATLSIKREKFHLPKFRVFIGDYDENFKLPEGVEPQYFDDTDSSASIVLLPETAGLKPIRGIIEEYVFASEDSVDSYRYPFEVELIVNDTIDRRNL
jgi:hypothetical protein